MFKEEIELKGLQKQAQDILEDAKSRPGDKGETVYTDLSDANAEKLCKLNEAMTPLVEKINTLRSGVKNAYAKFDEEVPRVAYGGGESKSLVDQALDKVFDGGDAMRNKGRSFEVEGRVGPEIKTTMSTSAGWAPESLRSGVVVNTVQKEPNLFDFLTVINTNQAAYKFMKETTHTNNAAPKAEAAAYGEAALALTETSVTIERVGVFLPITQEQLEDEPAAREWVNSRLMFMVRNELGDQVINGDGTSPNWDGILSLSGLQTQAKGTDPIFDAILKAKTLVDSDAATTYGGAMANLCILPPNQVEALALTRTADGIYILGNPADAVVQRVWGMPIVKDSNLASTKALIMDTSYFPVIMRRSLTMSITDSHASHFISNILTIKVDMRGALAAYRDAAACQVTGL